ncbi:MAG: DJ-1/PfpI family protein [Saonia sp.]
MELIAKEELDRHNENKSKRIAFYLQDGVEVLDFAGPMEVFSYAGFDVFTVSKSRNTIVSQGVLKITPEYSLNDAPQADILAFFGGNASNASKDLELIEWVKQQEDIEYYFSVCTGAFILAEAGILENNTATTFHTALDNLENDYPKIKVLKDARYVDNGNVITTAGISAGIDGALHLVAKIQGFNNARKVAYGIEYDKWTPGEGVQLTGIDPYHYFLRVNNLDEYLGCYEFKNNQNVEIKHNERENSIYAHLNGQKFPLFYLSKDHFKGVNGYKIAFKRDSTNSISGYNSSDEETRFYRKFK